MARHEFGIMSQSPAPGRQYDDYEPERYDCISIDDELIEPLVARTLSLDCFYHSLDFPGKGLNVAGITLIPPESLEALAAAAGQEPGLAPLKRLLAQAKAEGRYVIHFGI